MTPVARRGLAISGVVQGVGFRPFVHRLATELGLVGFVRNGMTHVHVEVEGPIRDRVSRPHGSPLSGGPATALCDIAEIAGLGIRYEESAVPVPGDVQATCSLLGLDPVHVADEGKLIAVVPANDVDAVVESMQAHDLGGSAAVIGEIVDDHHGMVVAATPLGASRLIDRPLGEQLPRIC